MRPSPARSATSRLTIYALCALGGPVGAWVLGRSGHLLATNACQTSGWLVLLLVAPVAEEIIFRLGVHSHVQRHLTRQWGWLSLANLASAALFGLTHALVQSAPLALWVALPAVLFGLVWEISGKRIAAPVALHAWYNACLVIASC